MSDIAIGLSAAAFLVLVNALFVAVEFALVAVDRSRIEVLAAEGNRRARTTLALLKRLSFHLSGAQLGITITSLVLGFVIEPTVGRALLPLVEGVPAIPEASTVGVALALALGLATATQMVAGELVPKNFAIARPVPTALALAGVIRVYGVIFGPVIAFLNGSADWTIRRLGIEPKEELRSIRSLEEVDFLIRSSGESGTIDEESASILTRSIRFARKDAADVLVPRGSVVTVRRSESVADLARIATETGFSRFPVIGRDIHDVVGVVHAKSVLEVPPDERADTPVTEIMREGFVVTETQDLESLLLHMRRGGEQLAIVADEHGSVAGVITLEDLLEEILGDIEDEYDPDDVRPVVEAPPGGFVVEGGLHRDELTETTGFQMPEGGFRTLAGFLLSLFERIPGVGDRVVYEGWEFEVVELDRLRISLVAMRRQEVEPL